jgi:hypothetical protein
MKAKSLAGDVASAWLHSYARTLVRRRDPTLFFHPMASRRSSVPRRSYAVITSNK